MTYRLRIYTRVIDIRIRFIMILRICHHSIDGSGSDRSAEAIYKIGPAILNGGLTSLLAMAFLAFSKSYGYRFVLKVRQFGKTQLMRM